MPKEVHLVFGIPALLGLLMIGYAMVHYQPSAPARAVLEPQADEARVARFVTAGVVLMPPYAAIMLLLR